MKLTLSLDLIVHWCKKMLVAMTFPCFQVDDHVFLKYSILGCVYSEDLIDSQFIKLCAREGYQIFQQLLIVFLYSTSRIFHIFSDFVENELRDLSRHVVLICSGVC